jgi:hypothetical protein
MLEVLDVTKSYHGPAVRGRCHDSKVLMVLTSGMCSARLSTWHGAPSAL